MPEILYLSSMNSVYISLADWLEKHALPCFYKQIFHMVCPGCGAQRAFVELLRGHFKQSLFLYPALLPILLMVIYLILHLKFKFTNGAENLKRLFILNSTIIIINYVYKLII